MPRCSAMRRRWHCLAQFGYGGKGLLWLKGAALAQGVALFIGLYLAATFGESIYKRWKQRRVTEPNKADDVTPNDGSTSNIPKDDAQNRMEGLQRLVAQERVPADWFRAMKRDDDSDQRGSVYHIAQGEIDWSNVNPDVGSAFIDFRWMIYNASVYTLIFGAAPEGKVKYEFPESKPGRVGTIRQDPELVLEAPLDGLQRTFGGTLVLRQYLPTEVRSDLVSNAGTRVVFRFAEIRVPVQRELPDGSRGPGREVKIESLWETQVPSCADLTAY